MSTATSTDVSPSQSPGLSGQNAPKYGTLVPNRVFVGGISANTTEAELQQLFSAYGNVKAAKIIADRAGVSKGYGFITFETEEEAKRIQKEADSIILKDRKLNVAPAVKKQPTYQQPRIFDPSSSVPSGTVLYTNGIPYTYHNGMAIFTPDLTFPQTAQYPVMYSQPALYVPQQLQYPQPAHQQWAAYPAGWRWPSIAYAQCETEEES